MHALAIALEKHASARMRMQIGVIHLSLLSFSSSLPSPPLHVVCKTSTYKLTHMYVYEHALMHTNVVNANARIGKSKRTLNTEVH